MGVTIRAHFDGKVIVPDETVTLPRDTPLRVHVEESETSDHGRADRQRAAYAEFLERAAARPVPHLPAGALRREAMYDE